MLAGLIFATQDATDREDALTATLPIGGMTLLEYQARTLQSVGVSQLIVVVSRLTPELLGAVNRLGRRGVPVDAVRSAAEAAEKLHPLARVLMLADGLVTTDGVLARLASDGGDALLVVNENDAPDGFERLGGQLAWAGVARLEPQRLGDVARLPRDYDLQSTLLRVAAQAGARAVRLPVAALAEGHGIERRASAVAERGRAILGALVSHRVAWFDRYVVAHIARLALPPMVDRAVSAGLVAVLAAVVAAGGWVLLAMSRPVWGLALVLSAAVLFALGATLARLRDEWRLARGQEGAIALATAGAALLLGGAADLSAASSAGIVLAAWLVVAAALAERAAAGPHRHRWWATPPAYLVPLLGFTVGRLPLLGLVAAGAYAAATLAAAIEQWRREP